MTQSVPRDLWGMLLERGLVCGEVPLSPVNDSPWYVRVMLGVAGWIGSLFLLGFVGIGFEWVMENAAAALIVGSLACGMAYALFVARPESDFFGQFAIAVSLTGQALLVVGLHKLLGRDSFSFYALIAGFEVGLTLLVPNGVHRVLTSFAAVTALVCALRELGVHSVTTGFVAMGFSWIWLQEGRRIRDFALWRPVGYSLALFMLLERGILPWLGVLGSRGVRPDQLGLLLHAPWIGKGLLVATFLGVILVLLGRLRVPIAGRTGLTSLVGATAVMIASFKAPGLIPALLVLLVAFAVQNWILFGLGLIATWGFLGSYYCLMQETLLVKSFWLMGLGVVLLVGRVGVHYLLPATDGQEGGHA